MTAGGWQHVIFLTDNLTMKKYEEGTNTESNCAGKKQREECFREDRESG